MYTHALLALLFLTSLIATGLESASLALVRYYYNSAILLRYEVPGQNINYSYFQSDNVLPENIAALPFQLSVPASVLFVCFSTLCVMILQPGLYWGIPKWLSSSRPIYLGLLAAAFLLTFLASADLAYSFISPNSWRYLEIVNTAGEFISVRDYGLETHVCNFRTQELTGQYSYLDGRSNRKIRVGTHCNVATAARWVMLPVVVLGVLVTAALCWRLTDQEFEKWESLEEQKPRKRSKIEQEIFDREKIDGGFGTEIPKS